MYLYSLATVLTIFVGFRDAAGRNARILKKHYYVSCIFKAFVLGQACLVPLVCVAFLCSANFGIIEGISNRCLPVFSAYTALVFLTFVPYAIPNWEIKSLVTVVVFGPLTLLQPLVILSGTVYAVLPFSDHLLEVILICTGSLFCLLFERMLRSLGWSRKAALIQKPDKE